MSSISTIERALELAASGGFSTVPQLEKALTAEGCQGVRLHLGAPTLRKKLRETMSQAQALRQPE